MDQKTLDESALSQQGQVLAGRSKPPITTIERAPRGTDTQASSARFVRLPKLYTITTSIATVAWTRFSLPAEIAAEANILEVTGVCSKSAAIGYEPRLQVRENDQYDPITIVWLPDSAFSGDRDAIHARVPCQGGYFEYDFTGTDAGGVFELSIWGYWTP